jgi:hypothetical protein
MIMTMFGSRIKKLIIAGCAAAALMLGIAGGIGVEEASARYCNIFHDELTELSCDKGY